MLISTFLSKNSMLFKQEHNTCKLEILSSFQKINIGTQKSSIHSIFSAGSTSLHACLYRHFSLKTACYLNKNTTHANWKFFLVFKKINIGTQKSSIHSIFPAGSTSLHACLYRHFSLKTACYLNKNTTHANWTKCHFHGPNMEITKEERSLTS